MYSTYMTWQINDITLNNNVVANTPANAYAMFCIDDQQTNTGGTNQLLSEYGAVMNGNIFHWSSPPSSTPPYPYIFPPPSVPSSSPVVYATHVQMSQATGLNSSGAELNPKGSTGGEALVD